MGCFCLCCGCGCCCCCYMADDHKSKLFVMKPINGFRFVFGLWIRQSLFLHGLLLIFFCLIISVITIYFSFQLKTLWIPPARLVVIFLFFFVSSFFFRCFCFFFLIPILKPFFFNVIISFVDCLRIARNYGPSCETSVFVIMPNEWARNQERRTKCSPHRSLPKRNKTNLLPNI